jgi:hypothetical protein
MSSPFTAIETLLNAGDFIGAGHQFNNLRPSLKGDLEGLKLAARIHSGANDWDKVSVLSRVMRNEFPADPAGFEFGAQSLHQQGRHLDAINLLKLCQDQNSVTDSIAQYQAKLDSIPAPQT